MRMRLAALLLLVAGCVGVHPPPPPPPEPRFTLAALQQHDPEMCRRMAEWDCFGLDCPDCESEASRARAHDVIEIVGAIGAIALAGAAHAQTDPQSGPLQLSTRADTVVETCKVMCRRCEATKQLCDP
jgi:hypothetical protein